MYFSFQPTHESDLPIFSWILCKHPETTIEKNLNQKDSVMGKFVKDQTTYELSVNIDPLYFLEIAKKQNRANYLHPYLGAVTPPALNCFNEVLRTAMRGNYSSDSEEYSVEELLAPISLKGKIGPFPLNWKFSQTLIDVFEQVGITATFSCPDHYSAFMLLLETKEPMKVSHFLQKIYLISYCFTNKYTLSRLTKDVITKFVTLSKDWVSDLKDKKKFVQILSKYHVEYRDMFAKQLNILLEEQHIEKEDSTVEFKYIDFDRGLDLHTKRHELVAQIINENKIKTMIDLGTSEGRLLRRIKGEELDKVLAIELDGRKIRRLKNIANKKIRIIQGDMLSPNLEISELCPDLLTLIEVIEHFEEKDRRFLIKLILEYYCPRYFILTTPNIEYNKNFEGMEEGKLRHWDHKIEYNLEQFNEEVISQLEKNYTIRFIPLIDGEEQPTFSIMGIRKDEGTPNLKFVARFREKFSGFHMPTVDYTISSKELRSGFSENSIIKNSKNIFYLSPTISPVEYNPTYPEFLEHPATAIKYYVDREIYELVWEEKYMGSRAHVLLFKNEECANAMGFKKPITIISRKGFEFFEGDDELLDNIYADIQPRLEHDFIILDAEITPWSYKAARTIDREFKIPGECTFLSRAARNVDTTTSIQFLNTLAEYSKDDPIQITPFHILGYGKINKEKGRFKHCVNAYFDVSSTNLDQLHRISFLITGKVEDTVFEEIEPLKYFRPCRGGKVHLALTKALCKSWEVECDIGLEGYVIKPMQFQPYSRNGYPIQPALKVRGKKYLRMVYGIDYDDPEYFEMLENRNVKLKRIQAAQQAELSKAILLSFMNNNPRDNIREKYIAAFLGMENLNRSKIDATL